MRHGTAGRRSRNRPHNGGGHNASNGQRRGPSHNRNHIFDSNGPDVRIRGTAYQVCEKYQVLAKDAASVGDTILAESYLQHAEHYQRIVNSWNDEASAPSRTQSQNSFQNAHEQDDDLSLPASVLKAEFKVEDENNSPYNPEKVLENV